MRTVSSSRWPVTRWLAVWAAAVTAVIVAIGAVLADTGAGADPALRRAADRAAATLARIPTVEYRAGADGSYDRARFGSAWTDAVSVTGGGNGCDTRNDVLTRDLSDITTGVTSSCPKAVLSGEFRSPYTGEFIVFSRERAPSAVQIDHIVPLAFAWAMGARGWPAARRYAFANDPANLVAVDARSNQDKSDAEPARWMPPLTGFRCQYSIQFVAVVDAYGLALDLPSRKVLAQVLRGC
ncbi:DUF1524 domain-containing protein [Gordonia pseudamarae]|uniref:DUF1524 domain-containing protein n=1 Tax=Gordonia pseudamarae TaxID=2831662 RepID=A0ABX6IKQ7_9ACTN|nr:MULTISPECIES: HNH endonuclease family protein [Gordonia]MBD0023914.1 HNH endonuclease [Gordonia sp. (in: high G+C Gram-positive bacteria)]QHN26986.1 DUF1524 domain-containing protein [Gordonia pseudamarae]QHN35875.1 DUF1524 domain-containing protein [Gordonia pseudamarae]